MWWWRCAGPNFDLQCFLVRREGWLGKNRKNLFYPANGSIADFVYPDLRFMQDNAPRHTAKLTLENLAEREIHPIFWPAFSPDLNPVETVWNKIKD